jgi:cyanate lyase
MSPEKTLRLREALRHVAHRRRRTLSELSRELGRNPSYLAKALGSFTHLRVLELFQLLALLEIEPREFFYLFFPLGMDKVQHARRAWQDRIPYELIERPSDGRSEPLRTEPAEWATDVARLLGERIVGRGLVKQDVSAKMGLSEQALAHVLGGSAQLHIGHVFGVLEAIGDSPERFFFELTAPAWNLPEQIAWGIALDEVERQLGGG